MSVVNPILAKQLAQPRTAAETAVLVRELNRAAATTKRRAVADHARRMTSLRAAAAAAPVRSRLNVVDFYRDRDRGRR
jgi:hypothetical protein